MIEVKEDYSLKPYNTFAIDVKCRYFVESDEEEALRAFVADYYRYCFLSGDAGKRGDKGR